MNSDGTISLQITNGWATLPSSLKNSDNSPRFNLAFPTSLSSDAGALCLISQETADGYETPTRNLIERTLRPGDLFIDVGAHWGLFTLQAATHPNRGITVISFEPEILNALILSENVSRNKLADSVTVICAGCGRKNELAPLVTNSTMGHSVRGIGLGDKYVKGPVKWIPIVPLDGALAPLQIGYERRIILKVDAEGFEPQIITGARSLIQSGRVGLIIWEWGPALVEGRNRAEITEMLCFLSDSGFMHFQPPTHQTDSELSEFDVERAYLGNVFSLPKETALTTA